VEPHPEKPTKDALLSALKDNRALLQSTSENSPEGSSSPHNVPNPKASAIPRVVIRHRIKGAKKAQKRLRKN